VPLYFFDVHDGWSTTHDTDGIVCVDDQAVRETATRILAEIAADEPLLAGKMGILTTVRDQAGCVVYTAALSVTGNWLNIPMTVPAMRVESEFV
jgi:hypothetical protein